MSGIKSAATKDFEPTFNVQIHEFGDLSNPVESCGDVFNIGESCVGVLGSFSTPTAFYISRVSLNVSSVIGRLAIDYKNKQL